LAINSREEKGSAMDDDFCLNISYGESAAVPEEETKKEIVEKQAKKLKKKENGKETVKKEEKPTKTSDDADNSSIVKKSKYKSLSKEEDPLQYHLKPRDLDYIAPVNQREIKASKWDRESHIFSSNPFSSLPLHDKLISLLQAPIEENGFNLSYSTKVQNVIIPLLHQSRSNVLMKSQTGTFRHLLTCSLAHLLIYRKR
jgi:hypothetical protein